MLLPEDLLVVAVVVGSGRGVSPDCHGGQQHFDMSALLAISWEVVMIWRMAVLVGVSGSLGVAACGVLG
jgi:hypothetical protein